MVASTVPSSAGTFVASNPLEDCPGVHRTSRVERPEQGIVALPSESAHFKVLHGIVALTCQQEAWLEDDMTASKPFALSTTQMGIR